MALEAHLLSHLCLARSCLAGLLAQQQNSFASGWSPEEKASCIDQEAPDVLV